MKYVKNYNEKLQENNTINNDLLDFFENENFNVYLFEQDGKQCAEIEKWTDGGVDMIITLMPFAKEKFVEYVDNFDVDYEIDFYRKDQDYKNNFTISESLMDFTDFYDGLKEVVAKLNDLAPDNNDENIKDD